jgi:hypothetical protein
LLAQLRKLRAENAKGFRGMREARSLFLTRKEIDNTSRHLQDLNDRLRHAFITWLIHETGVSYEHREKDFQQFLDKIQAERSMEPAAREADAEPQHRTLQVLDDTLERGSGMARYNVTGGTNSAGMTTTTESRTKSTTFSTQQSQSTAASPVDDEPVFPKSTLESDQASVFTLAANLNVPESVHLHLAQMLSRRLRDSLVNDQRMETSQMRRALAIIMPALLGTCAWMAGTNASHQHHKNAAAIVWDDTK